MINFDDPNFGDSEEFIYNDQVDQQIYYGNDEDSYLCDASGYYDEAPQVVELPCEFCKRSFSQIILERHRNVCYTHWLKTRDRQSKMEKSLIEACNSTKHKEEVVKMSKLDVLRAKRKERRMQWRQRHEDFITAVRAARAYMTAKKNGTELPAPPPPTQNPDLPVCPTCGRRFNQKSFEKHILRCKEQSILNKKQPLSRTQIEAKKRLATRLTYTPCQSRPSTSFDYVNTPCSSRTSTPGVGLSQQQRRPQSSMYLTAGGAGLKNRLTALRGDPNNYSPAGRPYSDNGYDSRSCTPQQLRSGMSSRASSNFQHSPSPVPSHSPGRGRQQVTPRASVGRPNHQGSSGSVTPRLQSISRSPGSPNNLQHHSPSPKRRVDTSKVLLSTGRVCVPPSPPGSKLPAQQRQPIHQKQQQMSFQSPPVRTTRVQQQIKLSSPAVDTSLLQSPVRTSKPSPATVVHSLQPPSTEDLVQKKSSTSDSEVTDVTPSATDVDVVSEESAACVDSSPRRLVVSSASCVFKLSSRRVVIDNNVGPCMPEDDRQMAGDVTEEMTTVMDKKPEDMSRLGPLPSTPISKFCHECGNKFPTQVAKFCCGCGMRRI